MSCRTWWNANAFKPVLQPPRGGSLDCVFSHNYITNSKCTEALVSMKMLRVHVNYTACVMCGQSAIELIYSLPASVINISLQVGAPTSSLHPHPLYPSVSHVPCQLPACLPAWWEGWLGGVDCGWGGIWPSARALWIFYEGIRGGAGSSRADLGGGEGRRVYR